MNGKSILVLLGVLALAACNVAGSQPAAAEQPPLAGAKIGGDFSLIDQTGRRVRESDFAGKYRLIYFGYTFCPDVCPVDLQKLMAGYALLEKTDPALAARLQPIFISVDPHRDTPAVLKTYVAAFHPKLLGLTGSDDEIAEVAKRYAVVYSRPTNPAATDYLVDHSRQAYLFGPKGEPIALISQEAVPDIISGELRRWMR